MAQWLTCSKDTNLQYTALITQLMVRTWDQLRYTTIPGNHPHANSFPGLAPCFFITAQPVLASSFLKNVLSWIDSSTSQLSVYNVCFIWSQTSRRPKHLFAKQAFGRVFADSITRVFKNGAGGKPEYSVFFGNYRNIPFCVRKLYKTQGKKLKNEVDSNMGW
jgi:hypothetical protein